MVYYIVEDAGGYILYFHDSQDKYNIGDKIYEKTSIIVNLAEEYSQISKNKNHPDTMISYIQNDTLYVGFKH